MARSRWLPSLLLALVQLNAVVGITFDPCKEPEAIRKGSGAGFVVGLAFWPGGTEADWGNATTGLQPCNATHRAGLTAVGVHFASYSPRIDRLSVLKTTFQEQLALTGDALPNTPRVVSVVAFRGMVRSEVRYAVSGAPALTGGTGFVSTLSLMAKFDLGVLKYLQFYNLTCNDCGGWRSNRCVNGTSCTLPVSNCTCADSAPAPVPSTTATQMASATQAAVAAVNNSTAAAQSGNATGNVTRGAAADGAGQPADGAASQPADADATVDVPSAQGPPDAASEGPSADPVITVAPASPDPSAAAVAPPAGGAATDAPPSPGTTMDPAAVSAPAKRRLQQRVLLQNATSSCNYTQFQYCAVTVNFAYDGLDVNGAAMTTASQVRKLNSYSLVSLFAHGKSLFFDFTAKYDNTMGNYWGKFGQAQADVQAAYSGNAQAGITTGSASPAAG